MDNQNFIPTLVCLDFFYEIYEMIEGLHFRTIYSNMEQIRKKGRSLKFHFLLFHELHMVAY